MISSLILKRGREEVAWLKRKVVKTKFHFGNGYGFQRVAIGYFGMLALG